MTTSRLRKNPVFSQSPERIFSFGRQVIYHHRCKDSWVLESSGLVHGSNGGQVELYPNLTFNGQCEAAFKFYEECLHGRTVFIMTYENAPMDLQTPPDWRKKIFHATFALAEFVFAGSDARPGQYQKPQGFALQFNLNDPVEAERIFKALSENGTVQMSLQETFWALRFGVLVDQFGISWIINCEKPA